MFAQLDIEKLVSIFAIRTANHSLTTIRTVRVMCEYMYIFFFFAVVLQPNAGHGLLILEVSRSHTTTRHSR